MSGDSQPRAKLPRTVILLGWVSFFADVSGEMTYPLLPLFVVGALGASATSLGWIEGVAQAVVAMLAAWAGWRSDRLRRRTPYIRWGYGLPVLGKALLAFATTWPVVLVGRTVDRFGKGMRGSPRDALIADAAGPEQRGRAFGMHRMMDTAGAMVGVLLAAGVMWAMRRGRGGEAAGSEQAWAFRVAFGVAAVLGLAAFGLTYLVRDPSPVAEDPRDVAPKPAPKPRHGWRALPRSYWIVSTTLLIFAIANSSDTFLLLRAQDVGLSPVAVILAYALFNLIYTVVSYPAGVLSDRVGRWRVIGVGWGIYALTYAGFAVTGAGGVWPLMAFYGVYMALTDGVGKALLVDHLPKDHRGTGLGIYFMASGFATLTSSVLAGVLWDRVGHAAPYWVGAGAAAAALVLVPFAARVKPAAK